MMLKTKLSANVYKVFKNRYKTLEINIMNPRRWNQMTYAVPKVLKEVSRKGPIDILGDNNNNNNC